MKQAILEVAADLFAKYGYDSVSMNDMAKKLKITKPALYYHFKGKREIYLESLSQVIEIHKKKLEKAIAIEGSIQEKLKRFIVVHIGAHSVKDSSRLMPLIREISRKDKKILHFLTDKKEEMLEMIKPLIEEVIEKSGKNNRFVDTRMLSMMLLGAMNVFITEKMLHGKSEWTPEMVADQIVNLFFIEEKKLI